MPIAADIFTAIYATMTDLQCRVRVGGRYVISTALSSGMSMSRESRDEGMISVPMGNVRFLQTADSTPPIKSGDKIEMMRTGAGETRYKTFRVSSKLVLAGVVRLELEEEF